MLSGTPKASRREWIALSVLTLPGLVYTTDLSALDIALPTISASLQPSSAQLLWLVDIYGFMMAGFLITMGTVGDLIGRRRLLMLGAAAFVVISCAASRARSTEMLIAMRALLGVAAATLAPSTMSLLRNIFQDEEERQLAIGIWFASIASGGVLGALAGGAVLRFFSWHYVFLIPVPPMILVLMLGPTLLPEYRGAGNDRLDWPSVMMSLASILPAIQGLKLIATEGASVFPLTLVAAGLIAGTGFVRRQSQLAHPLVDLSLFRQPRFTSAITSYGLSCFAMFGLYVLLAQYLQLVLALSPWEAGMATAPWPLATVVGSLMAPSLASRLGTRSVLIAGLITGALGMGMLAASIGRWGLAGLEVSTVVFSLGLALVLTSAYEMIVTSCPPQRSGAAAGIAETASEFGGAMGIALLGSIGTATYRHLLVTTVPRSLPPSAVSAALATMGGAGAAAAALPHSLGDPLLASARAAFSTALQCAAVAAAVAIAAACAVAMRTGRRITTDS